ncbi:MAG TPA: OmpH family outer membrane protein, partial [Pseudobdellovibrionaceae bacterium]|nr:OmpH family outer membrane protein [Pseudobdellovibrionaceae bacterium]
MKKSILSSALLAVLSISSYGFAGEVAIVDMQKAVQATDAGKKAKDEMESEVAKKRKDFEKKESDLRKTAEDIDRKKAVLSTEALT